MSYRAQFSRSLSPILCQVYWFGATVIATLATVGCGGSVSPANPPISVTLSSVPGFSIAPGASITFSAMVENDPANAGVVWNCSPSNNCGEFAPEKTGNGVGTTYTVPVMAPNGEFLTITAISVADPTKSASVSGTIKPVGLSVDAPGAVGVGNTVSVIATIYNDSAGAEVNWMCSPANICGSFSPTSTGSGITTNYTAPTTVPSGGSVTITATTVADPTTTASASILISSGPSVASLKGKFAFYLTSPTGNRGTTAVGGSVTFDGNGEILGGVTDIFSSGVLDLQDQILPTTANPPPATSSYDLDVTGRGRMRLVTVNGQTIQFSLVLLSSSHASLTEIDGNPGAGTLDMQQSPTNGFATSQITGGYSFTMTGTSATTPTTKVSVGGVFSSDGAGGLSNGRLDLNDGGVMSSLSFSGSVGPPDSNGRGTLQISGRSLIYYIVSPKALRVFEADSLDLLGGSAYAQGDSVIFLGNRSFYEHSGWSSAGRTNAAGQFLIAEGDNAILSGISDSNSGGSATTPKTGVAVTGSYGDDPSPATGTLSLVDAAGNSQFNVYVVDRYVDIWDPNNSKPGFFGGAGNALLLHTDTNINGTGVLLQFLSLNPPINGNFSLQLTNSIAKTSVTDELDLIGFITTDGSGHIRNGLADYSRNDSSSPVAMLGASITGDFTQDSIPPGHFVGSLSISQPPVSGGYPFISSSAKPLTLSCYQFSESKAFVLQTDSLGMSSGVLNLQVLP